MFKKWRRLSDSGAHINLSSNLFICHIKCEIPQICQQKKVATCLDLQEINDQTCCALQERALSWKIRQKHCYAMLTRVCAKCFLTWMFFHSNCKGWKLLPNDVVQCDSWFEWGVLLFHILCKFLKLSFGFPSQPYFGLSPSWIWLFGLVPADLHT